MKSPALAASPWETVAALYRRICILRAQRQHAEAGRLESADLATALEQAEAAESTADAFIEHRDQTFRREEERVLNAAVIAEILAPLLAAQPGAASRAAPAGDPTPKPQRIQPSASESDTIADLLDGMLAQTPSARPARR